jgi:hypothetical protein
VHPLDNPIWHALTGPQVTVAEGTRRARCYHPDFSVFSALPDDATASDWDDLAALPSPEGAHLVIWAPDRPPTWTRLTTFAIMQMEWTGSPSPAPHRSVAVCTDRRS